MKYDKPDKIVHILRIGETNEGFVIGAKPPVTQKLASQIGSLIQSKLLEGSPEVQQSIIISDSTHNEWTLPGATLKKAITISNFLAYQLKLSENRFSLESSEPYPINNTNLFDQ